MFAQASILDMYDPDRSQIEYVHWATSDTWSDYTTALKGALNSQNAMQGTGLRILSAHGEFADAGFADEGVLAAYPQAKWVQYEPLNSR